MLQKRKSRGYKVIPDVGRQPEMLLQFGMLACDIESIDAVEIDEFVARAKYLTLPRAVGWRRRPRNCRFEDHQPRPVAIQIEPGEHISFGALDVNGEKMNLPALEMRFENRVQR